MSNTLSLSASRLDRLFRLLAGASAVLLPLVNQAQVFYDARGCTGVRMTLRVG